MGENNPSLSGGLKGKSKAKLTEPPGSGGANLVGENPAKTAQVFQERFEGSYHFS